MNSDIFGTALLDYFNGETENELLTISSIAGEDTMPLSYLFRSFAQMPKIEQKALSIAKGSVLDLGAGAGSHSLYLQKNNFKVTALDISKNSQLVCQKRGIENCVHQNIFDYNDEKFDTILALMNGTGICGTLNNLSHFLTHLKELIKTRGQILIDSSDIIYMFEQEDGSHWIDASLEYYGEVTFQFQYKNQLSEKFNWLYVDYNTLQRCALYNGFNCELVTEGTHYDYLARLTVAE